MRHERPSEDAETVRWTELSVGRGDDRRIVDIGELNERAAQNARTALYPPYAIASGRRRTTIATSAPLRRSAYRSMNTLPPRSQSRSKPRRRLGVRWHRGRRPSDGRCLGWGSWRRATSGACLSGRPIARSAPTGEQPSEDLLPSEGLGGWGWDGQSCTRGPSTAAVPQPYGLPRCIGRCISGCIAGGDRGAVPDAPPVRHPAPGRRPWSAGGSEWCAPWDSNPEPADQEPARPGLLLWRRVATGHRLRRSACLSAMWRSVPSHGVTRLDTQLLCRHRR